VSKRLDHGSPLFRKDGKDGVRSCFLQYPLPFYTGNRTISPNCERIQSVYRKSGALSKPQVAL
jgi:hypothetical protein